LKNKRLLLNITCELAHITSRLNQAMLQIVTPQECRCRST